MFVTWWLMACREPTGDDRTSEDTGTGPAPHTGAPADTGSAPLGHTASPGPTEEEFVHQPAALDLLFVIDDSCSMAEEQTRLISSFPPVLAAISALGLSLHVGVVSTDMDQRQSSGRLKPDDAGRLWIDETTPAPAESFRQMALLGTVGSATEAGFEAMATSLELRSNDGFRREGAQYAVVVLSDEDDESRSLGPEEAAAVVLGEAAHPGDGTFSSVVTPPGACASAFDPGLRYLEVTDRVGGVEESICVADYSPALVALTSTWWTSPPYVLSGVPADPSALEVTVDGAPVAEGLWVYDPAGPWVRFTGGFAPAPGAAVRVAW